VAARIKQGPEYVLLMVERTPGMRERRSEPKLRLQVLVTETEAEAETTMATSAVMSAIVEIAITGTTAITM
jgi:hypothetical protein